jgi:hypothetical protein
MKRRSVVFTSIMYGFVLSVLLSVGSVSPVYGASPVPTVRVTVSPDFLGVPEGEVPYVESAFISRRYSHFSEDGHLDRSIPNYIDQCSFMVFRIVNGKLFRDVYLIMNPEGITSGGFYDIEYQLIQSTVRATLRINEIKILRLAPSKMSLDTRYEDLFGAMQNAGKKLLPSSLSPLYRRHRMLARVKITIKQFDPIRAGTGRSGYEYLGSFNGKDLFRIRLFNADTERYKREWDFARGFFCYLVYDRNSGALETYYAVVDYSIYTK